jgi:hypothetical protein
MTTAKKIPPHPGHLRHAVSLAERPTDPPLDTASDTRDAHIAAVGNYRVDGAPGFFIPRSRTLLPCPNTKELLPIRHDVGFLHFDSRRGIFAAPAKDFASPVGKGLATDTRGANDAQDLR